MFEDKDRKAQQIGFVAGLGATILAGLAASPFEGMSFPSAARPEAVARSSEVRSPVTFLEPGSAHRLDAPAASGAHPRTDSSK